VYVRICDHSFFHRGDPWSWMIQHLNHVVHIDKDPLNESEKENTEKKPLRIEHLLAKLDSNNKGSGRIFQGKITPETEMIFYGDAYNMVLYIDWSLSVMSIDPSSGDVVYETMITLLRRFIYDCVNGVKIECHCHTERQRMTPTVNLTLLTDASMMIKKVSTNEGIKSRRSLSLQTLCHLIIDQ
jgi:hypothetical protein